MTPSTSTRLEHIPDHEERAEALLPFVFRTRPRFCALVQSMGAGVQLLEDALYDVVAGGTLDNATLDALGQWGDIVGEEKGALLDEEYRLIIRSRVLANKCGGTRDELIVLYQTLTAPSEVRLVDNYPAALTLTATRGTAMRDEFARRVRRVMVQAKTMGVRINLVEAVHGSFAFDTPGAGYDVGTLSRVLP